MKSKKEAEPAKNEVFSVKRKN